MSTMAAKSAMDVFIRKGVDEKTAEKLVEKGYTFTKVARTRTRSRGIWRSCWERRSSNSSSWP